MVFGEGDVKRDTEAMHMEKLSRFHTNMSFLNEIAVVAVLLLYFISTDNTSMYN